MSILLVITRSEPGGAQVHVRELLRGFAERERLVLAVGDEGFLSDAARALGIDVRVVGSLQREVAGAGDLRALSDLRALIRDVRPRLVHTHSSKAGILGRLAARAEGVPCVHTAHAWSFSDGLPLRRRLLSVPEPAREAEPSGEPPAPARLVPPPVLPTAYLIGAEDVLQVTVYGEPSLSGQMPVDATGAIDVPLIGRVAVTGRNAVAVGVEISERLRAGYITNPNVTVSVASYRSQPVQVLGAVAKPGVYFLRGPTTLMQLLSEAGGVATAGVNEVRVSRGDKSDTVAVIAYEQLLRGGAADRPLSGGDIVFVPQSLVSVMGQVGKPGEVSFRDGLTVSQCVAAAGGALPTAALGNLYILRGDKRLRVNLRRILAGTADDLVLQAGDRLYVPESAF